MLTAGADALRSSAGGDGHGVRPPDADPGGHGAGGAAGPGHLRLRGHRHRQDSRLHAAHPGAARLQAQTGQSDGRRPQTHC